MSPPGLEPGTNGLRAPLDPDEICDFVRNVDEGRPGHEHAAELFELARRRDVELATAPQGYRLDVEGDLAEQLRAAFEREEVGQARQVARVSEVTFVGADLIIGNYVEGFVEAWDEVVQSWRSHEWTPPGPADRLHVETHLVEGRDVSSPTTSRSG